MGGERKPLEPGEPTPFQKTRAWLNMQFAAPLEHPVVDRYPFAVGLREQLLVHPRLKPDADPAAVCAALQMLVKSTTYLRACNRPGARRYGVYGVEAGEVTAAEAAHAESVLAGRKKWEVT